MNTFIVKSVPLGDFEKVSISTHDENSFLSLIGQRKAIQYETFELPNLSKEIQSELSKQGFVKLILESDTNQYFLVPRFNRNLAAKPCISDRPSSPISNPIFP